MAATGSAAPWVATATIQLAHQAAGAATSRPASGADQSPTAPPASPSTVAGATAGAAARLATTATRLTWPETACHQRRAGQLRGQWHADRLGDPAREPPGQSVAPPRRQPDDAGGGQDGEREARRLAPATGRRAAGAGRPPPAPGCRGRARRRPSRPAPRGPSPRPAARSARLRASSTNPTTPSTPTTTSPRARTPDPPRQHEQAADDQGQVGARDGEQMGQPGRPEGLGQLGRARRRRHRRPVPGPACAPHRDRTDRRIDVRSASAPRRSAPGWLTVTGGPRGLSTPARSRVRAGWSRPRVCTVVPRRTSRQRASPITSNGARTRCRTARPTTISARACRTT